MVKVSLYLQIKHGWIKVHQRSPEEHRFWAGVDKNGPVHPVHGQCWLWTKNKGRKHGYGLLRYGPEGKQGLVHRYSWILHYGEIPEDMWVLHACDVRNCCRPTHLWLGTHQDNMDDRDAKGRNVTHSGEENGNSKCTEEEVLEIRWLYANTSLGYGRLALRFNKSRALIRDIVKRRIWTHI